MKRAAIGMGLLGGVGAALLALNLLVASGFDPSVTIKFGENFPENIEYAEGLLGSIVVAPMDGHDGRFFFSQAMDPFYLEPDQHAVFLDRPTYRAQRMAYPTLASLGGLLPAQATAWGLIVVNVLAMGIGTAFTSLVAVEMGISRWFGLAFLLNPGMIVTVNIDGGGVVALAAMMGAVYFFSKGSMAPAAAALTMACLARETMLIAAVGLFLFGLYREKRIPWILATPAVAVVAWWMYVHWRLEDGLAQDTQALGVPFVGFVEAFQRWLNTTGSTVDLLMGSALLLMSVLLLIRASRTPTALGWAVAGFALLGIVLSEPVWFRYFNSSRALAPVLTAYVLLMPAQVAAQRRTVTGGSSDHGLDSHGDSVATREG